MSLGSWMRLSINRKITWALAIIHDQKLIPNVLLRNPYFLSLDGCPLYCLGKEWWWKNWEETKKKDLLSVISHYIQWLVGYLNAFKVGLELRCELFPKLWESEIRLVQRHAITIFSLYGDVSAAFKTQRHVHQVEHLIVVQTKESLTPSHFGSYHSPA